ncbi:hypothetical protein ISS04_04610 [Candidatus Woesearchaeota archaeon]|nr:hypothetical protein [Candidatus Woesearchaeota archaeon]
MSMPSSDVPMVNWLYFAGFFFIIISIAADKHIHGLFQSAKHRKKFREVYEMRIANLLKTAAEYTNIGDLAMAKKFEKKAKRLAKKL